MKLTNPTLANESLQVSVQADGEANFTGAYTARSVLVRHNGDRIDFPSEQVVVWNRDGQTVPLDAEAGVFTSRLLTEFTVRLECARDAPSQPARLCPADGDAIETNITFSSTSDASVHDTALLRSEIVAIPSCNRTEASLTPEGRALHHDAPDVAITVTLADVDGLPINFTDPVGLQVTWTGPGAPGGATTVPLTRTEARSNVLRSRIPREYRGIPGQHTLCVSMSGLITVSDSAPGTLAHCTLLLARVDVECAAGYAQIAGNGCSSYIAGAIVTGILMPVFALLYYRAKYRRPNSMRDGLPRTVNVVISR
jgi:hypothetical protein